MIRMIPMALIFAGLMTGPASGCASLGSGEKEAAVAPASAKAKAAPAPGAEQPGPELPGVVPEEIPQPGVSPMDMPGVDPLSDENLVYRVLLYWQARTQEKFDTAYAIESKDLQQRAPTLIKYIQRLGKSPKEYKETRFSKLIRNKQGDQATVFTHQRFKLTTPMLVREFVSEEPEIWLQEDGTWRRQFVDYAEVFRKQMGFELPDNYDPNSRQVAPPADPSNPGSQPEAPKP